MIDCRGRLRLKARHPGWRFNPGSAPDIKQRLLSAS